MCAWVCHWVLQPTQVNYKFTLIAVTAIRESIECRQEFMGVTTSLLRVCISISGTRYFLLLNCAKTFELYHNFPHTVKLRVHVWISSNVEQGSPDPQILAQIMGALVRLLCGLQCKKSKNLCKNFFLMNLAQICLWYYGIISTILKFVVAVS